MAIVDGISSEASLPTVGDISDLLLDIKADLNELRNDLSHLQHQILPLAAEGPDVLEQREMLIGSSILMKIPIPILQTILYQILHSSSLLVSIVHQFVFLAIFSILDFARSLLPIYYSVLAFAVVFQIVHLAFVSLVTSQYIQMVHYRVARISDLVQAYLSVALLYAGIYCLLEFIYPGSFNGMDSVSDANIFTVYFRCLYLSITALSTVGYGDVSPNGEISRFFVFCETLTSVCYVSILFGNVLFYSAPKSYKRKIREMKLRSQSRDI